MTALVLSGYPQTIWASIRATLVYAQTNLSVANPQSTKSLAAAVAQTLENGSAAFSAYLFSTGTQVNFSALSQVAALALTLDPATQGFLQNRVAAMQSAIIGSQALQSPPNLTAQSLAVGKPVIPYPGYLEFLLAFPYEAPPDGLTTDNFVAQAQACADSWATVATALQTQGVLFTGTSLNSVQQMGLAAQATADAVSNIVLATNVDLANAWNTLVAAPTISRAASITYSDPTSLIAQSLSVARYVTLTTLQKFNVLLTTLRTQQATGPVRLAKVRRNDNLMDIANRELGSFEEWRNIATLNSLVPPYVSNTKAPGVAAPGDQLFLPTPNGPSTPQAMTAPNYLINYLGVDLFLGPLNQPMLPWTGDFQIISGYQNLAFSLGRRLQTLFESLIYHPDFGSRIPPEVGSITDQTIANVLAAYTSSCLASDPRVEKVLSVNVQVQQNNAFKISSTVRPNGIGASEVTVNEVFGPA